MLSADGDPGRHLVVGEYILASRSILDQDVFSHTMAGQRFVPYEWLAEVASALTYRWAGPAGPAILHGTAIGLALAVLFWHLRSRGHAVLLTLAVALLATVTSSIHWLARPHVFTFLGIAVFGAVLDGWHAGRLRPRWLWVLPLAMLVWANTHGGFLVGLLLVATYVGADVLRGLTMEAKSATAAQRRLALLLPAAAATLAMTLLNPAGPALLGHVTGYLRQRLLVDRTVEYMSPNFHDPSMLPFLAMLLATVAGLAWSRRRPALHEGLLLLGFTYFALYSARNISLFTLVVAPVLAAQLAALPCPVSEHGRLGRALRRVRAWLARREAASARLEAQARGHVWPAAAVAALLFLAAAQRQAGLSPLGVQFDSARQPMAAASYLAANPPVGNGFNELRWGGYLLHALWPAQRVFIDGQTDFYGEALTRDYLSVVDLAAGWQAVLDRYAVRWVVYPTDSALVRQLAAMPAWRVAYQDAVATVLTRAERAERADWADWTEWTDGGQHGP